MKMKDAVLSRLFTAELGRVFDGRALSWGFTVRSSESRLGRVRAFTLLVIVEVQLCNLLCVLRFE